MFIFRLKNELSINDVHPIRNVSINKKENNPTGTRL